MNKPTEASVVLISNIPGEVKKFHYVRNHHYLILQDRDGNEARLIEHGVVQYICEACDYTWWSEDTRGGHCPCCGSIKVKQNWCKPQVALIPEKESGFKLLKCDKADSEDTKG